jgi:RimJ/RimL family protein N-acetyltransferase
VCASIGIALLPASRGRGVGTTAQRLLARLLFDALPIARVQADTATDNPAERKALERAGFTCEALLRGAEVRDGRVRDRLLFSMTRADLAAG